MQDMSDAVRLYLVRHGRPTGGFAEVVDPGLDEVGAAQAEAVAQKLESLGPLAIITSPLRRARETAAPLEKRWNVQARVEPAVAEIPTPGADPPTRAAWLREVMRGRWADLSEQHQQWRQRVVETLLSLPTSTVVTTHFIAINVVVGVAIKDDRIICCEPDHCSCTVLEVCDGQLRLVSLGEQRKTQIL
ncbi:MAG: histidine phosphatase family protein [Candidatus Binatia bacterium]